MSASLEGRGEALEAVRAVGDDEELLDVCLFVVPLCVPGKKGDGWASSTSRREGFPLYIY